MEVGVYKGISNDAYHGGEGISKSGLDLIARSPLHYWSKYLDPDRVIEPPTPAMQLGTAIHSAVLEPDLFASDYVVVPEGAPRRPTKAQLTAKKPSDDSIAAIEWWREFDSRYGNKTILTADDYTTCTSIQTNVLAHPAARTLIKDGEAELSVLWRDAETGVLCKCRPDWMNYKANVMVDVKSTEDASPEGFQKSIAKYGYHVQAAWYLDGFKAATGTAPKAFVFAAFEKKRPYATAFYYADEAMIELGRILYRERLNAYAECLKRNSWPGYPQQLQPIGLPAWVLKAANDNEETEIAYV